MKTRILSLTTLIALLLTLAACSSDEAPDNFEPRLVTGEASGVTRTEAVIAGEVVLQGSTDMPELRFRYGTTDQMDHTTGVLDPDGNKVKMQLTGLQPGTMYYYRLHATNGRAELHGNTMTFVTVPNDRPTVGVPAVLSQGPMSVIVEYEITDDGNETITSTGCYVTDIETGDTQSVEAETPGAEGVGMRVRIGGLRQNATYEIKAYAANGEGESVGEALTITTSDAVLLADAGEFEELMGDSKYEYITLSTVKAIGDYAFQGCHITRFTLPDNLTEIGQAVFYDSSVEEVVMPSGLRLIPTATFQKCDKLTTVRLGAATELISDYVFDGCPLEHLYVDAQYPPVCNSNALTSTPDFLPTCTLHVPKGRRNFYRADSSWKRFGTIVEE